MADLLGSSPFQIWDKTVRLMLKWTIPLVVGAQLLQLVSEHSARPVSDGGANLSEDAESRKGEKGHLGKSHVFAPRRQSTGEILG